MDDLYNVSLGQLMSPPTIAHHLPRLAAESARSIHYPAIITHHKEVRSYNVALGIAD